MMPTNSKRAALACRVTITAPTYPGYPDPTRPTGWADIPAVILAADLAGREDIEYTAMLNRVIIPVDDATLAISEPNDGTRIWLLGLHFDNGLADIDLVSLADTETITMFTQAELLLVHHRSPHEQLGRQSSSRTHSRVQRSAAMGGDRAK